MSEEEKTHQPSEEPSEPQYTPNSTGKRIAALVGVIFIVALTILFTYSIATGGIFAW